MLKKVFCVLAAGALFEARDAVYETATGMIFVPHSPTGPLDSQFKQIFTGPEK